MNQKSESTAAPASENSIEDDVVNNPNFETVGRTTVDNAAMTCRNVDVSYGNKQAIFNVSIDVGKNEVLAMIGPSGCGKSTFLRVLNRMNDTIEICRVSGDIRLEGEDPRPACGAKLRTDCINQEPACPVVSSSASVLPELLPSARRSF